MRKFAVVQWINGEDGGKYSEVRTEAIRSYDDSRIKEDGYLDAAYAATVEWQKGKKPRHGWPVYAATIKYVSSNRFHTTNKIKELVEQDCATGNTLPVKRPVVPPARYDDDSDEMDIEDAVSQRNRVAPQSQSLAKRIIKQNEQAANLLKMRKLEEENQKLKKDNETLREMLITELPNLIAQVKTAINPISTPSSSEVEGSVSSASPQPPTASPQPPKACPQISPCAEKVEIYPGSNTFVDSLAWAVAQNANSPSSFVRTLLTAVFPLDVLLVSNLRGNNRDTAHQRQPLDKAKVDAIYRATLLKWPQTVPSSIGVAINSKLSEIRAKNKNTETLMLFQ